MRSEDIERVLAFAEDTLGDSAKRSLWLKTPNTALAGCTPHDLLKTADGALKVEMVLGRIAYGVHS